MIRRDAKSTEHSEQQKCEPELETKSYGFGEHLCLDAIALPAPRGDQIVPQFLANAEHMHIEKIRKRVIGLVEQMFVKFGACDQFTAMLRKIFEDCVFTRGKRHGLSSLRDDLRARVQVDVANF